jgi:phosphinothricin acetyltransferase
MRIRNATLQDLDDVLAIFNHEIVNDVMAWDTEPVEGPARLTWWEAHSQPGYPLLVAVADDGTMLGWASLSLWAHHSAYARTVELSIYVHQNHRGRGVGRALLTALIEAARLHGYHALIGRSDATNEASRRLHLGAGFRSVGVMREAGYKFGRYRDAELYELLLD